jgi:dual specificity phosphatase 12
VGTIANSLGMSSASQSDSSEMPTAEGTVPRRNSIRKGKESFDLSEGPKNAARKLSMMAMTPSEKPQISLDTDVPPGATAGRRSSGASPNFTTTAVPILVNPKCSGYFVEPVSADQEDSSRVFHR